MFDPLVAAAARTLSWPVDAAAFRGEWRRDALALSIVLLLALGAWVIQECDRRRVLRALLIATVATLLAGIVGAIALASVGML